VDILKIRYKLISIINIGNQKHINILIKISNLEKKIKG
jgi:hypothetical protein